MLTTAFILSVTCQVVLGQDHGHAVERGLFRLDMETNSADDRYNGCAGNMSNLVKTQYLIKELNGSPTFKKTWEDGVLYHTRPEDNLTTNHSVAIYVYTSDSVYVEFNENVRIGKEKYKDRTYTWYSLQFLLTEAIQILKKTQKECKKTYRGTDKMFEKNVVDSKVRFGRFASSSLEIAIAKSYGNVSCFEINTCHGADVTKFSKVKKEKEVLIPPYEKFKVTAIKKKGQNGAWCDTVYVLESSGITSDLNCAVASVESQIHHRCQSLLLTGLYIFIHFSSLY
ncbi:Erythroblast NAD(P)(+)--arginine ADP-ribosyltransferase [Triplophysa tibetana]|uniref:NAD(P)(+)--arginine ADP-ribosyltransferase n=1 Tax=Triplophysa tibetana TaxID=1572043 RepID=A0A5A9N9V3_9TELE|nr:Erythroblast NAD(P)(+)--arginine ADP-ribosyltransferase [Triplophysa tibetana]